MKYVDQELRQGLDPGGPGTLLAIDLGTSTGWALRRPDRSIASGTEDFGIRRGESRGLRFLRFQRWLREMLELEPVGLIAFEQVHHRGGHATEVLAGLQAVLLSIAAERGIEHAAVHTATLKKVITGSGRGSKDQIREAVERRLGRAVQSDDEGDAVAVLFWAEREFFESISPSCERRSNA